MSDKRLTLLLDLDDTLLKNSMDSFLPGYLQAWGNFIAPYYEPKKFVHNLLACTQMMVDKQDHRYTLSDTFYSNFYAAIGAEDIKAFNQLQTEFYAEIFPTLRPLTQPIDGAVELVEKALKRGYRVAIATNPLFPLTANEQRLEWAGLPVDRYSFELVPSLTTFHFSKPNPAFYAEFLANLSWPEGPVIMLGNDPEHDILGAHQLGLTTYWLGDDNSQISPDYAKPDGYGDHKNFFIWLDQFGEYIPEPDYEHPTAYLATLRSTPAALQSFLLQQPGSAWLHQRSNGEWAGIEIIAHMRDVEQEVNLPRLQKVLIEDNPFLPGMDTDPWAEQRNYIAQDPDLALHDFSAARFQITTLLSPISNSAWMRQARHAIFGRTNLAEIVSITARHDRLHIRQMKELIQRLEPPA